VNGKKVFHSDGTTAGFLNGNVPNGDEIAVGSLLLLF